MNSIFAAIRNIIEEGFFIDKGHILKNLEI